MVMGWRCLMLAAKPRQLSRDEVNSAFSLVTGKGLRLLCIDMGLKIRQDGGLRQGKLDV